jgi:glyoxylase-like metal-dependent hydrolase (beta-lactamase superfamily II)
MKIIPLSEGSFTIDKTKQFIPFDTKKDDLQKRPVGSLLVEIQPFCIVTSKDTIVIDTGLGFSNSDGTLQIHQNLLDNGINPMDVNKVLLSHLHKDHAGGISIKDEILNQHFFSFPNAVYYVNKDELKYASIESKSYVAEDFEILHGADKVTLMEGDGNIDGYIRYQVSGAHCPYHQVFWIQEDGEIIFFGGDVAPQLQQMKRRFIAKYDFDGKKCMELRQQWWQQGQQEKWTFLFYHDIKTPVLSFK